MSYHRERRGQGAGAIAASVRAPRSAPAPMLRPRARRMGLGALSFGTGSRLSTLTPKCTTVGPDGVCITNLNVSAPTLTGPIGGAPGNTTFGTASTTQTQGTLVMSSPMLTSGGTRLPPATIATTPIISGGGSSYNPPPSGGSSFNPPPGGATSPISTGPRPYTPPVIIVPVPPPPPPKSPLTPIIPPIFTAPAQPSYTPPKTGSALPMPGSSSQVPGSSSSTVIDQSTIEAPVPSSSNKNLLIAGGILLGAYLLFRDRHH